MQTLDALKSIKVKVIIP